VSKATVKLSELVEDFDIYPRHSVDSAYVSELARAIQAGVTLPLARVDKKTKRIVDGFHRVRAWRKVLGRGGEIEVDLRSYASEQDLLKEAIELNAAHGRKLDQQDRSRSALLLERHGVTVKEIAVVLRTTEQRVQELINVRVVLVKPPPQGKQGGNASPPAPEKRPAKPVAYPQPGEPPRELTPEQYRVMESSGGHRTAQTVTQLTRELEAGVVDLSLPGLREKLWKLHDVIESVIEEPSAA
jgi:hypothetical protein